MLNPFPDLFWLGFFAPTIIRVVAAGILLFGAYTHFKAKGTNSILLALAHTLVGGMLLLGYYTQYAALLGMVGSLKGLLFAGRYKGVFLYQRSTYILLFAICASLLISGAGAYAFDLPL
jgi:hypothetical protein